MKTKEESGAALSSAEKEMVHNILESTFYEIRRAFWKNREGMQVLQEMGQVDNVKALEEAEKAISKALSEYERLL